MIRKLQKEDWEQFKSIRLIGLQDAPQVFSRSYAEEVAEVDEYWRVRLSGADRYYYGFFSEEKLVSIAGARKTAERTWMIISLYTLPDFRNKGFGTELIDFILAEIRLKGATTVQLRVNIDQTEAVSLYKKFGFVTIGTENRKMGDGNFCDEYIMEKRLS